MWREQEKTQLYRTTNQLMNNKFLPGAVLLIIAFVLGNLAGIGFLQSARAVVPPPDGGYPGFNTAEAERPL